MKGGQLFGYVPNGVPDHCENLTTEDGEVLGT